MLLINSAKYLYNETGLCPKCSRMLVPVTYYRADKGRSVSLGTRRQGKWNVTEQMTDYSNITACHAGYCVNCARTAHEELENNYPKPKPTLWLIGLGLLALGGLCLFLFLKGGKESALWGSLSIFLLFAGFMLFVVPLEIFIRHSKAYKKHQNGYREPFVPETAAVLSKAAASHYGSKDTNPAFFDEQEMKTMMMLNGHYPFGM